MPISNIQKDWAVQNESIEQILKSLHGGIKSQMLYSIIAAWVLTKEIETDRLHKQIVLHYLQSLQQRAEREAEEASADNSIISFLESVTPSHTAVVTELIEKLVAILNQGAMVAFSSLQSILKQLPAEQVNEHWQAIRPMYVATLTAAARDVLRTDQSGVRVVRDIQGNPTQTILGTDTANQTVIDTVRFETGLAEALEAAVMRESPAQVMERVTRSHQLAATPTISTTAPVTVSASRGAIISPPVVIPAPGDVIPVAPAVPLTLRDVVNKINFNAEMAVFGRMRDAIVNMPNANSNRPTQNIKNIAKLLGGTLFKDFAANIKKIPVMPHSPVQAPAENAGTFFEKPVAPTINIAGADTGVSQTRTFSKNRG